MSNELLAVYQFAVREFALAAQGLGYLTAAAYYDLKLKIEATTTCGQLDEIKSYLIKDIYDMYVDSTTQSPAEQRKQNRKEEFDRS